MLAGAALALVTRPEYVLRGNSSSVAQFDTQQGQLLHAKIVNTPGAWKAVWQTERFPSDTYAASLAQQGLARYYFSEGDYRSALTYCQRLTNLDDSQKKLKNFGHLGMAICHGMLGDRQKFLEAKGMITTEVMEQLRSTDRDLVAQYSELASGE